MYELGVGLILNACFLAVFGDFVAIERFDETARIAQNFSDIALYNCRSSTPQNHVIQVKKVLIFPEVPTVPGDVSIILVIELSSSKLPIQVNLETSLKMVIPYIGYYNIPCYNKSDQEPCGGVGSCLYCNILGHCRPLKGHWHTRSKKANPCALPAGKYTVRIQKAIPPVTQVFVKIPPESLPEQVLWEIGMRLTGLNGHQEQELACGVVYVSTKLR